MFSGSTCALVERVAAKSVEMVRQYYISTLVISSRVSQYLKWITKGKKARILTTESRSHRPSTKMQDTETAYPSEPASGTS